MKILRLVSGLIIFWSAIIIMQIWWFPHWNKLVLFALMIFSYLITFIHSQISKHLQK